MGVAFSRSPKQESELADRLGGGVVKGSGCGDIKGDVRLQGVARIECKTTTKKSFSVTREMLDKIEDAAVMAGEVPAMVVEFIDEKGKPQGELAIVPTYVLDTLING